MCSGFYRDSFLNTSVSKLTYLLQQRTSIKKQVHFTVMWVKTFNENESVTKVKSTGSLTILQDRVRKIEASLERSPKKSISNAVSFYSNSKTNSAYIRF